MRVCDAGRSRNLLKNATNFTCERLALLLSNHFLCLFRVYLIVVASFPSSPTATQLPFLEQKIILPNLLAQKQRLRSALKDNGPSTDHDFSPPDVSLQQQLAEEKRNSIAKSNFVHPRWIERRRLGNDHDDSRSASSSPSIEIRLETITFPRSALTDRFCLSPFRLDFHDRSSVEMRLGGLLFPSECESE